jgi:hypothetical protein
MLLMTNLFQSLSRLKRILGIQTNCQNAEMNHSMLQRISHIFYTVTEYQLI